MSQVMRHEFTTITPKPSDSLCSGTVRHQCERVNQERALFSVMESVLGQGCPACGCYRKGHYDSSMLRPASKDYLKCG